MNHSMSTIARSLTYRPDERMILFRKLSVAERSATFLELSLHLQQSILRELSTEEIVDLLDNMDMLQVERVLTLIPNARYRKRVIERLKTEIREKIDHFLRFHPQASLSLVNFNYLYLSATLTIGEAANIIDEHYEETGKYPEILVQEKGELCGEVPFAVLVRERNSFPLKRFIQPLKTISYQADISEIVDLLTASKSKKVVVLDKDGSVLGLIYAESVRPLFEKLPAESLYDFAGVMESEGVQDSVGSKVKHRYKWLIINLGTGFLAAAVVSFFEDTLSQLVLLAVYMPIIAGMGGNAATQTLAVMVRGIAVGDVRLANSLKPIMTEVGAGLINGLINGVLVALIATLWNQSPLLGLVLGIAMVCNLIIAGFFGAFVPVFMKAIGKDPATSATIFITTATDVFGFFIFLGLATLILL
ncbi:MAG: magnesium transporter [Candidatus Pacebacteria bacterium]|nr:magnesium transporter [Candidatus Paceibacterota bacterium]MBP9842433.1 magnesium transporter [Candidatus Paceibacterota bacterium]